MNSHPPSLPRLAILASLFLAACGGGGGGTEPPPPTGPSVTITADDFTVDSGHSDENVTVSWAVTGVTGNVTVTLGEASKITAVEGRDYKKLGNSLTGSVATDLRGGTNDIYVYDGAGMEIGHKAVAGSCASGSTWNDKKVCAPNAGWTYSEFALVVYEDNCKKIGWVDLASPDTDKVKELTNKTGHNEFTGQSDLDCSLGLGALPVAANDSLAKFADGTLLVSLVTAGDGNIRRWFPVNPVTKEILPEWTGAVPKNTLQSTGYGTWGDTPYADHDIGNKGMYASLASGLLYITNSDAARLRFTLDIENFATYDVISDRYAVLGGYQFAITVPAH
ncbi:MAG: hypothetical protein U1F53_22950 [Burkholderiaceae bacterium]